MKNEHEHAFQPYIYSLTYSLRPFSRGDGANAPPPAIYRFRPPAFIGLSLNYKTME